MKKATRDPTLDKICAYLDEHGWDTIREPRFFQFLRDSGIDESSLCIHVCGDGKTPLDQMAFEDEEVLG